MLQSLQMLGEHLGTTGTTNSTQCRGKGPVHVLRASERITTHPIKQTTIKQKTQIAFKLLKKEIEFKISYFPQRDFQVQLGLLVISAK